MSAYFNQHLFCSLSCLYHAREELTARRLFCTVLRPPTIFVKALGIEVEMPGGKGILVPHPLTDPDDFEARIPKEVDVKEKLSHVIQAVARIKQASVGSTSGRLRRRLYSELRFYSRCCKLSSDDRLHVV